MIHNVAQLLASQALRNPEKKAFCDESTSVTFASLYRSAAQVASDILQHTGSSSPQPIPVFSHKNVESVVAFLGVVMSGNFYVPIDQRQPLERQKLMLSLLDVNVVVSTESCILKRPAAISNEILVVEAPSQNTSEPCWDLLLEIAEHVITSDPLYLLFTSGTTGVPKGVVISHGAVLDYIEWLGVTFRFNQESILGNQAPFYFDNSIVDLFVPLSTGATTWLIPERLFTFPVELIRFLYEQNINSLFWVPSALSHVANSTVLQHSSEHPLPPLTQVLFCGEVMPAKTLNAWRSVFPQALFANLYGPTETTDVCSYYIVDRMIDPSESVPIGKPCSNVDIVVLGEDDQLVSNGEIGELCVRGECLSLGYFDNPEQTARVFVQNPRHTHYRDLMYRTGDLVRYNERSELLFVGRKDQQIKYLGHRIELEEIEAASLECVDVLQACALFDASEQSIILICSPLSAEIQNGKVHDIKSDNVSFAQVVYAHLKSRLPAYMLPQRIEVVDRLVLNANGKIDRKVLKQTYCTSNGNR